MSRSYLTPYLEQIKEVTNLMLLMLFISYTLDTTLLTLKHSLVMTPQVMSLDLLSWNTLPTIWTNLGLLLPLHFVAVIKYAMRNCSMKKFLTCDNQVYSVSSLALHYITYLY